jgi:Family of unknown function (DUF5856)
MTIFPKEMMGNADMSLESVTAKLTYFQVQLHLLHWQTTSFAEHKALDTIYSFVVDFTDEVVEKLMGYANRRVKVFKLEPLSQENSLAVINSIIAFAYTLIEWAEANHYCDIENLAQSLSGEAAKTKYLLTLK